jgi:lipopolysaccharide transport system ATP-binding protein
MSLRDDTPVVVKGLGKRFQLAPEDDAGYRLATEAIADMLKTLGRRPKTRDFWALRDISFEVARGETLGVIGHNGAGKSTLLKILSRISPPTEGEARLRGRVGALLEVGTGFHPELTGRENVFLNGAILSMKREEIARKFDEIVEFADIGPFIDTPVKRYSSGMQLRLAFSVASHLEPEILIIDEVLSVGDLAFRERCLQRMDQASQSGTTVIFISHDLGSVRNLCDRALLLSNGRIAASGSVPKVIDAYVSDVVGDSQRDLRDRENRDGSGALLMTDLWFERNGRQIDSATTGEDLEIVLRYETTEARTLTDVSFGIMITDKSNGTPLLQLYSETTGGRFRHIPARGEVRCRIRRGPLPAGEYHVSIWADGADNEVLDRVMRGGELTVSAGDFYGSGRAPLEDHRTVLVDHDFSITEAAETAQSGEETPSPSPA